MQSVSGDNSQWFRTSALHSIHHATPSSARLSSTHIVLPVFIQSLLFWRLARCLRCVCWASRCAIRCPSPRRACPCSVSALLTILPTSLILLTPLTTSHLSLSLPIALSIPLPLICIPLRLSVPCSLLCTTYRRHHVPLLLQHLPCLLPLGLDCIQ